MEAAYITMKRSDHDGRDKHRLQTYNLPAVTMETLNECSLSNSQARLCDKQLLNAGQSRLCYSQYAQVVTLQLPKDQFGGHAQQPLSFSPLG